MKVVLEQERVLGYDLISLILKASYYSVSLKLLCSPLIYTTVSDRLVFRQVEIE